MKISKSHIAVLVIAVFACGPSAATSSGGQDGEGGEEEGQPMDMGTPPSADWAIGWWWDNVSNVNETFGLILRKFEVRADGVFYQEVNYCKFNTWTHTSRWELLPDGALRVVATDGEEGVPFTGIYAVGSGHLTVMPGDDCGVLIHRGDPVDGQGIDYVRGHRAMVGSCEPGDEGCECSFEPYDYRPTPLCEE